jgi:hypothetical protein
VDQWYAKYQPDGIFFDEGSKFQAEEQYYKAIRDHVRTKPARRNIVVLNAAGYQQYEGIMDLADIILVWEDTFAHYTGPQQTYDQPSWLADYPPERIAQVIFACPTATDMATALTLSRQRGAGHVYVFDLNPDTQGGYHRLPTYWLQEVCETTRSLIPEALEALADLYQVEAASAARPRRPRPGPSWPVGRAAG